MGFGLGLGLWLWLGLGLGLGCGLGYGSGCRHLGGAAARVQRHLTKPQPDARRDAAAAQHEEAHAHEGGAAAGPLLVEEPHLIAQPHRERVPAAAPQPGVNNTRMGQPTNAKHGAHMEHGHGAASGRRKKCRSA